MSSFDDVRASAGVDRAFALALLLLLLVACARDPSADASGAAGMSGANAPGDVALADTLRHRIEEAYDFSRPDIVARMTALYPARGRVISASGGQITATADSLRAGIAQFWERVGQNMKEPRWVWHDVYVDRLGRDAAVLTARWSIPHIAPTDEPHVIRGAWTAVFRRLDGEWKIVQEHLSVPQ